MTKSETANANLIGAMDATNVNANPDRDKLDKVLKDLSEMDLDDITINKFLTDDEIKNANYILSKSNQERIDTHSDIKKVSDAMENQKTILDEEQYEYDNTPSTNGKEHKMKLDIYDRNIEDNLYIIYYFLSYGILGLFLYKLIHK